MVVRSLYRSALESQQRAHIAYDSSVAFTQRILRREPMSQGRLYNNQIEAITANPPKSDLNQSIQPSPDLHRMRVALRPADELDPACPMLENAA